MSSRSMVFSLLLVAVAAGGACGQTHASPAMLADAAYILSDGASTASEAARLYTGLAANAKTGTPLKNDFAPYGSPGPGEWHGFVAEVEAIGEELSQLTRDVRELHAYRDAAPVERYLSSERYRRTSQELTSLQAAWAGYEEAVRKADLWIERINEREWMRKGCSECAPSVPARERSRRDRTERRLTRKLAGASDSSRVLGASTASTLTRVAGELSSLEAEVSALEPSGGAGASTIGAKQMGSVIGIGGFTAPPPPGAHQ